MRSHGRSAGDIRCDPDPPRSYGVHRSAERDAVRFAGIAGCCGVLPARLPDQKILTKTR